MILMHTAYYCWAREQVVGEVASNFETLRELRTPLTSHFLKIMASLPDSAQVVMWKHLLKRFHVDGATAMGDPISDDDRREIQRYDVLRRTLLATLDPEVSSGQIASAAQLQEAARDALSHRFRVSPEKCGKKLLRFVNSYRGGVVHTYLDASSSNYQLCYWHNVLTTSGQIVLERCSVLEWFGISSQTFWDATPETQMEQVAVSIANSAAQFISFFEAGLKDRLP